MLKVVRQTLLYLWALPTTSVGLLVALPSLATGGRARIVQGVLEVHGGLARWILIHLVPLEGGASAMTLGHIVLGRDSDSLDRSRPHERIHVLQCERWGPLFLPAYGLSSLICLLRRKDPYRDNRFEREAYDQAST